MEQVKSFKEVGQVGTPAPQGTDLTGVAQKDYVRNLKHQLFLLSPKKKDYYLVHTLNEKSASSSIVFTHTCNDTHRLALMLGNLGIRAKPISGQMIQEERLDALNIFNSGECNILVCSDVGSRGLDIPFVDTVINYTIPPNPQDYIHRVARTKFSILLVNQDEIMECMDIENKHIGKKLFACGIQREEVLSLTERVNEANRLAIKEMEGNEE